MAAVQISIAPFLDKVNEFILNPIIVLLFAVAFVVFMFGLFQFVKNASDMKARDDGKKRIIYGLIGMFIMFSAYGLIHILLTTFGINSPGYVPL